MLTNLRTSRGPTPAHFLLALLLAGIALLAGPYAALAQDAPAGDGGVAPAAATARDLLLPAVQDAFVAQAQPGQNFGGSTQLLVALGSDQGVDEIRSYAQWNLASIPPGVVISSAVVELYQLKGSPELLLVGRPAAAWNESTIVFDNAPRWVNVSDTWRPGVDTDRYVGLDITALVQEWLSGQTVNNGLVFYTLAANDGRSYAAREAGAATAPRLRITYTLPPIRACYDSATTCKPVPDAQVHNLRTGEIVLTDANGRVPDAGISLGDGLWAKVPTSQPTASSTLYATMPATATVQAGSFVNWPGSNTPEMRLVISQESQLLLQDLNLSAQWYLGDNPALVDWLRTNLIKASDFLYDFTEGQFALGTVTVRQAYEGWNIANIKLHTNNTLHPNAVVGGIVTANTPDVNPAIPEVYAPGRVYMGSYWNRFGAPPGQPVTYKGVPVSQAEMADDWAIALAHELGHYLLFLFDTYTDPNGVSNEDLATACTGSAMGNAYPASNHAFISSQLIWNTACGGTEAFARLQGRTEWATIQAWHPWVAVPFVPTPGGLPPVELTTVQFITPAVLPGPLASQVYTLNYQAGETSSGEARAFLFRGDKLIFEQGKPAKGTRTLATIDARVDDRLCVYDLNDHAELGEAPRHQFGCRTLTATTTTLDMTRNLTWNPLVTITQTGPQQLTVTVFQRFPSTVLLRGKLYPEAGEALPQQTFSGSGSLRTAVFNLPTTVVPVYVQIWVEELAIRPQTRREVVADRGTGGNGAFGPARLHSGVMSLSSDGKASYAKPTPLTLNAGAAIAWQSMPGTPPFDAWLQISGQSYRLGAYPANLVADGSVSIEFTGNYGALAGAGQDADPAVYFWNGTVWTRLPTTLTTPTSAEDNTLLATAPSQGVGVYAVMREAVPALYLPSIQRR